MISSGEIRRVFLEFFRDKGHTIVPSSSLIPGNDRTLLFTNAGMVQFKDVFTGSEQRTYGRAASAQRCMRVSGKHNDLENVGPSPRHHTFFEMLGNFSFGDYFKRDAIAYAWEFLTQVMKLDPERLYPTIYRDDDQALGLWQEVTGLASSRITRLGKKDNFWTMGDTGPNGPCSEIIYDRGPEQCTCGQPGCNLAHECDRWWELWNLVFMQFETTSDGSTRPLPRPSIDTGMGMERLTAVMQGKDNNYETDLFWPIIQRTQQLLGHTNEQREDQIISYRVIADHARAIAFLIADGVLPGNEGRSYVLRLILRRAARHGKMLGFERPFVSEVIQVVTDTMGEHYTDLTERRKFILEAATQEEERFLQTLDTGLHLLDEVIAHVLEHGQRVIPGEQAFRLYDTYGFPLDLTRDVAKEHSLVVDEAGFKEAMQAQRDRARAAQHFVAEGEAELYRSLGLPATSFVGYEAEEVDARILALVQEGHARVEAKAGDDIHVVLDRTPFYAESGGQVSDVGRIVGPRGRIAVRDAYLPLPGLIVHVGQVEEGRVATGDRVQARIDEELRFDIARNHTATHLLHSALQLVLGSHARQAGSLVSPHRLRFDFTHLQAVTADELRAVECRVNEAVRADLPVQAEVTSFAEARQSGAMALFGEKYGDQVRVVSVGDEFSRELCGGTHLKRTGQIGFFKIVDETSIGSGVRRIEALTGRGAEEYVASQLASLAATASALQASPDEVAQKATELTERLRELRRSLDELRSRAARSEVEQLQSHAVAVDATQVLAAQVEADSVDRLREMTDVLRERMGSAVIVLGAVVDAKPMLVASVTPDLVDRGLHAGRLVGRLARVIGGGGGGRPTMAQAGGRDSDRLPAALDLVQEQVRGMLAGA